MPDPGVLGIMGTIIVALLGLSTWVVRLFVRSAEKQVDAANTRADRYEAMLMQALGANERLIPLVERQASLVQTVEDVVGHSMSPTVTEGGEPPR